MAQCLKTLPACKCLGLLLLVFGSLGDSSSDIITIPLDKQYVPVQRDGKTVAHKTAYFGTIFVGLPFQQNFTVVFDTGSGHLLLPSSACVRKTCLAHNRYDPALSSTSTAIDYDGQEATPGLRRDQVDISFGTGKVTGDFVYETMCMKEHETGVNFESADLPADCIRARLITATKMTKEPFLAFEFDGVLGLGLEALALDPEFSFFGQMARRGALPSAMFSVFVARSDNATSEISFGGYNPERASSALEWVSVLNPALGHWQIRVNRVRVGNETLPLCDDGSCVGILDTGTSLLGVPKQSAQEFNLLLARPVDDPPAALDCRTWPGPEMVFELEGLDISMGHEEYSRPAAMKVENNKTNVSQIVCRAALLPVHVGPPIGDKVFIFGEPALRKYYTAYDWEEKRIGFSLARQPDAAEGRPKVGKVLGAPAQHEAQLAPVKV